MSPTHSTNGYRKIFLLLPILALFTAVAAYEYMRSRGAYEYFFDATHRNAIKTRSLGDGIVSSLEAYEETHGVFPRTLDELTPKYLPTVPRPIYGSGEWSYRRDGQSGSEREFCLSFHAVGGYPTIFYESRTGKWAVDD